MFNSSYIWVVKKRENVGWFSSLIICISSIRPRQLKDITKKQYRRQKQITVTGNWGHFFYKHQVSESFNL